MKSKTGKTELAITLWNKHSITELLVEENRKALTKQIKPKKRDLP